MSQEVDLKLRDTIEWTKGRLSLHRDNGDRALRGQAALANRRSQRERQHN
jgi:hypothetical protein